MLEAKWLRRNAWCFVRRYFWKSLSREMPPSARDPPGVSQFARAARPKGYARETQLVIEIRGLASSHKERDEMGQKWKERKGKIKEIEKLKERMRDEKKSRKKRFDWEKKRWKKDAVSSFLVPSYFFPFFSFSDFLIQKGKVIHCAEPLSSLATQPPATMSFERRRRYSSSWLFLRNCLPHEDARPTTISITTLESY